MVMITAEDARLMANKINEEKSEFRGIINLIKIACKKGHYSITIDKCLPMMTEDKLIEFGYKLNHKRNGHYVTHTAIEWRSDES